MIWNSLLTVLLLFQTQSRGVPDRKLGELRDNTYRVSSGQDVERGKVFFEGRPADFALHPDADLLAVQTTREVFLCSPKGVVARTKIGLPKEIGCGFRGMLWTKDRRGANWTPKGMRFVVSTDQGYLQEYLYEDLELFPKEKIWLVPEKHPRQVWPGGMCLTKDAKTLYVAVCELNSVCKVDIATHKVVQTIPVQRLPFECRLSEDEKTLIVSNWGGRTPEQGDETGLSNGMPLVINHQGWTSTGTLSLIDLGSTHRVDIPVGLHPSNISVRGRFAYVSNSQSDNISEIDLDSKKVARTFPLAFGKQPGFGAMPCASTIVGSRMYVCEGGNNAVAVLDLNSGKVTGLLPTGYFPISIEVSHDGKQIYVLNSKGNGSIANTSVGNPGNPHDFQGSISILSFNQDLAAATARVIQNNHWDDDPLAAARSLAVYKGAVKHVLYIIKENQNYDPIYGDMPEGNGDPTLCVLGESVMPNHRKMAREFTLFDNMYCAGTNSADGHAWCTQAMANDYMEREYVGYRTYPDDGDCSMSLSAAGSLWDATLKKNKTLRVYGEYCDDELATYEPRAPKDWFEAWDDYKSGRNFFHYHIDTRIPSLKPYVCHNMHYWPIIESDQHRADVFLGEYNEMSKADKVPNLMILTLTNDHGSGLDPKFPTIASMMADNDLAFGRVVDAVTHSPQWKDTCIFMIEDDGQALPDHVDGHRTAFTVISPYTKRHYVDSTFYTTVSLLRSIELMLGLDPMNAFDAATPPVVGCFQNDPDYKPYVHCLNKRPLDERNRPYTMLDGAGKAMYRLSMSLDWKHLDAPDPAYLSRVHWYSLTNGAPYPERYASMPRTGFSDDDDN
jgi:hypothetical protein